MDGVWYDQNIGLDASTIGELEFPLVSFPDLMSLRASPMFLF